MRSQKSNLHIAVKTILTVLYHAVPQWSCRKIFQWFTEYQTGQLYYSFLQIINISYEDIHTCTFLPKSSAPEMSISNLRYLNKDNPFNCGESTVSIKTLFHYFFLFKRKCSPVIDMCPLRESVCQPIGQSFTPS